MIYSMNKAATELGVSSNTIRKYITQKKIMATRNQRNNCWEIESSEVKRLKSKVKPLTLPEIEQKVRKEGYNSLKRYEKNIYDEFNSPPAPKSKKSQKPVEDNIIILPKNEMTVEEMFIDSKKKRIEALFDILQNGRGVAVIQAEKRLAEIEKEVEVSGENLEIDLNWDISATRFMKESS